MRHENKGLDRINIVVGPVIGFTFEAELQVDARVSRGNARRNRRVHFSLRG